MGIVVVYIGRKEQAGAGRGPAPLLAAAACRAGLSRHSDSDNYSDNNSGNDSDNDSPSVARPLGA